MHTLLIVTSLLALGHAISFVSLVVEEWETFKLEHNKKYNSRVEDKFRLKIFMENKHRIAKHNARFEMGHETFKLKINKFADLLSYEFNDLMNRYRRSRTGLGMQQLQGATHKVQLPDEKDWRTEGYVTDVKDQGQCGSCWAFTTTGSLESQNFGRTGKLVSLSEQNLIDCSTKYGNKGCNGGFADTAFHYIEENNGIDTEISYPYEGKDGMSCRYNPATSNVTVSTFMYLERGNEDNLKQVVAVFGPVAIAIDAAHESFQFYHQGVYFEPKCNNTDLNHGVLVVGYGTDETSGLDYWLIKNSWGTQWGDQGYVKMARNRDNHCGIATDAIIPFVKKTG